MLSVPYSGTQARVLSSGKRKEVVTAIGIRCMLVLKCDLHNSQAVALSMVVTLMVCIANLL